MAYKHRCWCVEYLRADGTPPRRHEYFRSEEVAAKYCEGSLRNGAKVRYFRMEEVTPAVEATEEAAK